MAAAATTAWRRGDYEGTRFIQGREEVSIYREYAEMIEASLLNYFSNLLIEP